MNAKELYDAMSKADRAVAIRKVCESYFKSCPIVRIGAQPSGVLIYLFGSFLPKEMDDVQSAFYRLKGLEIDKTRVVFFAGTRWAITKAVALYQAELRNHDMLIEKAEREYVLEYNKLIDTHRSKSGKIFTAYNARAQALENLTKAEMNLTTVLEDQCRPQVQKIDARRSELRDKANESLATAELMRDALFLAKA